ncbi:MAG: DNA-directed RNA polymerase subunit A'', partial [Thermoprotei archaeon]
LARAAFEMTVRHLLNAAIAGEEDQIKGVSESVIVGQPIPMGTGMVDLRMKLFSKSARK